MNRREIIGVAFSGLTITATILVPEEEAAAEEKAKTEKVYNSTLDFNGRDAGIGWSNHRIWLTEDQYIRILRICRE